MTTCSQCYLKDVFGEHNEISYFVFCKKCIMLITIESTIRTYTKQKQKEVKVLEILLLKVSCMELSLNNYDITGIN